MLPETIRFEPRDANRIQPFCDRLARAWGKLPDWRFGQLMVNLMSDYNDKNGRDVFFLEEDSKRAFEGLLRGASNKNVLRKWTAKECGTCLIFDHG